MTRRLSNVIISVTYSLLLGRRDHGTNHAPFTATYGGFDHCQRGTEDDEAQTGSEALDCNCRCDPAVGAGSYGNRSIRGYPPGILDGPDGLHRRLLEPGHRRWT